MLNKLPSLFPWKHNKTKAMADVRMELAPVVDLENLLPCGICGRTFLPESLSRHTRVCEKNACKKRRIFNSLKQRVEGTDLAPFHQKRYLHKPEAPAPASDPKLKQSKWKEKHLELVNAIRAAKGAPVTPATPVTTQKKSVTAITMASPNERCPSCDRQFGPKAFDRHVEWCKEHKSRIHKSPANVLMAKERLEARTKYKVPPLNKSRRSLTREKYSPTMSRTESVTSVKSTSSVSLERSPSIRKPKSMANIKKVSDRDSLHNTKSEKVIREQIDKCGEVVRKDMDKLVPKDVKKGLEPMKSSFTKLPKSKVNSIDVNDEVAGLTVSKIIKPSEEGSSKKLMTWKETVIRSHSDNSATLINIISTGNLTAKKTLSEGGQMKTFGSLPKENIEINYMKPIKKRPLKDGEAMASPFYKEGLSPMLKPAPPIVLNFAEDSPKLGYKSSKDFTPSRIPVYKDSNRSPRSVIEPVVDSYRCEYLSESDASTLNMKTSKTGAELIEETRKMLQPKRTLKTELQFFGNKPEVIQKDKKMTTHKSVLDKYKIEGVEFMKAYKAPCKDRGSKVKRPSVDEIEEPPVQPGDPCCSYVKKTLTFKDFRKDLELKKPLDVELDNEDVIFIKSSIKPEKIILKELTEVTEKNHICNGKKDVCDTCKKELITCGLLDKKTESYFVKSNGSLRDIEEYHHHNTTKVDNIQNVSNDLVLENLNSLKNTSELSQNEESFEILTPPSEFIDEINTNFSNTIISNKTVAPSSNSLLYTESWNSFRTDETYRYNVWSEDDYSLRDLVDQGKSSVQFADSLEHLDSTRYKCHLQSDNGSSSQVALNRDVSDSSNYFPQSNNIGDSRSDINIPLKTTSNKILLKKLSGENSISSQTNSFFQSLDNEDEYLENTSNFDEHKEKLDFDQKSLPAKFSEKVVTNSGQLKDVNKTRSVNLRLSTDILERHESLEHPYLEETVDIDKSKTLGDCEKFGRIKEVMEPSGILAKTDITDFSKLNSNYLNHIINEECNDFTVDYKQNHLYDPSNQKSEPKTLIYSCSKAEPEKLEKEQSLPHQDNFMGQSFFFTLGKSSDMQSTKKSRFKRSTKKMKMRSGNVIFLKKSSKQNWDLDSLDGQNFDPHNEALSTARIHMRLRKCSSEISVNRPSDFSLKSFTDIDLVQDSKLNEDSKRGFSFSKDRLLEVAGEQFLASLKSDFDKTLLLTSTPTKLVTSSYTSSECIPTKRRRLDDTFVEEICIKSGEDDGNLSNRTSRTSIILGESVSKGEFILGIKDLKKTLSDTSLISNLNTRISKQAKSAGTSVSCSTTKTDSIVEKFTSCFGTPMEKQEYRKLLEDNIKKIKVNVEQIHPCKIINTYKDGDCIEKLFFFGEDIYDEDQELTITEMEREVEVYKKEYENYDFKSSLNVIEEVPSDKVDSSSSIGCSSIEDKKPDDAMNFINIPSILDYPQESKATKSVPLISDIPIHLTVSSNSDCKVSLSQNSSRKSSKVSIMTPRFENVLTSIFSNKDSVEAEVKEPEETNSMINISKYHCKKLLKMRPEKVANVLKKEEPLKLPKIFEDNHVKSGRKLAELEVVYLPNIKKTNSAVMSDENSVVGGSEKPDRVPKVAKPRFKNITMKTLDKNRTEKCKDGLDRGDSLQQSLDQNPFISAATRQLQELFGEDIKSISTSLAPIERSLRPNTTSNTPIKSKPTLNNKKMTRSADKAHKTNSSLKIKEKPKRASVIDPPLDFKDQEAPFHDSFELLENLINDNCSDDLDNLNEEELLNLLNSNKNGRTGSLKIEKSADTLSLSALLNERKYSDDMSMIDPRLINEHDNLAFPDNLKPDNTSPVSLYESNVNDYHDSSTDHYSVQYDKKISELEKNTPQKNSKKLKNDSLNHSVSMIDDVRCLEEGMQVSEFISTLDEIENYAKSVSKSLEQKTSSKVSKLPKKEMLKSSISINSSHGYSNSPNEKKKSLNSLKKSISLLDPVANPKSFKSKEDIENYFDDHQHKTAAKTDSMHTNKEKSIDTDEDSTQKPEELFSVDDEMYEEYKKYEQMYLKEKEERMKKEGGKSMEVVTGSEDDESHLTVKISGDSAYGRKTPKVRARATKLAPLESKKLMTRVDSPSSSGSENSPVYQSPTPSDNSRMSKFCHECGNKYPLTSAKFCVECGVRRLVL